MKKVIVLALLLTLGAGLGGWYWYHQPAQVVSFRTTTVQRGNLVASLSATGTVEPEEVVDVGAQVAGQIESFGRDPQDSSRAVDYGTVVEKGTILAHIDASLYRADVEQAQAQVDQAKATVRRAEADLGQLKAKLHQANRDWVRAQQLFPSGAVAAGDYDAAQAAYDIARAGLGVGEATLTQTQQSVAQAQAALRRVERNLDYCTIRSPVQGVIVDRRVNVGQTVVASLNAPSLFLIARDLKRLQVWASVNEADIGQIHAGQAVRFTVDAYPGEVFVGQVNKIRLNATMTQNVVTYTVEVATDNSSGKLLPYLTANVQFVVGERKNVLLVPNAALRFVPTAAHVVPEARATMARAARKEGGEREKHNQGTLWVQDGDFLRPLPVRLGLTDGVHTEVSGPEVADGLVVVTGEQAHNGSTGGNTNPFAPKLFGTRKGS